MTRVKLMADDKEEEEEYSENNIERTTFVESQKSKEHQISYDDSINTEDSINTSEVNASQHSQPIHENSDNNGDSQLSVQYDVHDHTTSFTPQTSLSTININNNIKNNNLLSCLPPHVMVVPQELLISNNDNSLNTMQSCSCSREQHERIEPKTTNNVNGYDVTSQTMARNQEDMPNMFVNALSGSNNNNKLKLNAKLLKLPHSRHGQLVYFLIECKPTGCKESTNVNVNNAHKAQCKIYELHAQRTSSSFPLAWFIDNTVIPSRVDYMYLTSPFNIGYFTLRILLESNNMCHTSIEREHNSNNNSFIYNSNNNHNKAEHCFVSKEQLLSSIYQTASYQHNHITSYDNSSANKDFLYKDNYYHKKDKQMPQMREWCEEQEEKYSIQKEEWNGWLVMAQNDLTLQVLLQEIISHTQLAKFCDYKCVSFNNVSDNNNSSVNDGSKQDSEYYYKFNKSKVVDWLVSRIQRLARSDALRELLHLPPANQNSNNKSSDSENECNKRNQRQCTEAAFQLVMEYVDECMHDEVAQACDLPCTNTSSENKSNDNPTTNTKCKRSTTGYTSIGEDKENVFDNALLSTSYKRERMEGKEASTRQRQSTEKSASVKRLEKAGKPANTPTLFEMFASKNKNKK